MPTKAHTRPCARCRTARVVLNKRGRPRLYCADCRAVVHRDAVAAARAEKAKLSKH
mgnify:CR=1 FL=1